MMQRPSENHHNANTNFVQVRIFLLVSVYEVFKPVSGGLHVPHSWRQMEGQDRLGTRTGRTAAVFRSAQSLSARQRPNPDQGTQGVGRVGTHFTPRISRHSAQDGIQAHGTRAHASPRDDRDGGVGTWASVFDQQGSGRGNNSFGSDLVRRLVFISRGRPISTGVNSP